MAAGLACSAAASSADVADPSSRLSSSAKTRDAIRGIPLATMAAAKRSTKSPTGGLIQVQAPQPGVYTRTIRFRSY